MKARDKFKIGQRVFRIKREGEVRGKVTGFGRDPWVVYIKRDGTETPIVASCDSWEVVAEAGGK